MDKKKVSIAIIGLGYVGLPLAVQFSRKYKVVGFDLDKDRITELTNGFDRTNELTDKDIKQLKNFHLTYDHKEITNANIFIVTVPTPVDKNNKPNLEPLKLATQMIAGYLDYEDIVIYESTVFPGCTEEVCVPILEKLSKLKYNNDFFCGYSPERINPGDKEHILTNIVKIVSGSNYNTLEIIDDLYSSIIKAKIFRASAIIVAEAAKVIENTQRDVNIALMNELAIIFDKLNISTSEVLDAASTKWNFLPFKPGLVGGHCIGVDPYYLTHKAIEIGYHPEIILAGRRINDNIGSYIASKTISEMTKNGINPIGANVSILGLTFKENCPDIRNTRVASLFDELINYKCNVNVSDSWALPKDVKSTLDIDLVDLNSINDQDAVIIAVGHNEYCELKIEDWKRILKAGGVMIDVKSVVKKENIDFETFSYWSL